MLNGKENHNPLVPFVFEVCLYIRSSQRKTLGVLFYGFLPYCFEAGSLTELGARLMASKLRWASYLHPVTILEYRLAGDHARLFIWVLGIWTQVLLLAQQVFLPTDPSLQPETLPLIGTLLSENLISESTGDLLSQPDTLGVLLWHLQAGALSVVI